jgi:hypothetical protein
MKADETLDPRIQQIGAKLRRLRLAAGYKSYETFAFEHELSRVSYGKHEAGNNITMKSLLRLLDIHQLTLAQFFADLA